MTGALRNPWLAAAVLCGVIVSIGLIGATVGGGGLGLDFRAFWIAARAPLGQVYNPDPYLPFAYPPPLLPWLRPLAWLPFWPAFAAWSALSLIAYSAAARSRSWLLLGSPVVIQSLLFGQTSLLLAAGILAAARSNAVARGALLGMVFAIKPQLLILAPLVLLARRDWAGIAGFAAATVGSLLLSLALYGPGLWIDWLRALPAFRETVANRDLWWVMITPFAAAMRLGLNPWPVFAAGAALAALAAVRSKIDPVELICLTSLLASPYAVANDLAALLPFCLARLQSRDTAGKPWAALIYATALVPGALAAGAADALGLWVRIASRRARRGFA